jgi:hypothetical protein
MSIEAQIIQRAEDMGYTLRPVPEVIRRNPPRNYRVPLYTLWRTEDEEALAVFGFESLAEASRWLDKSESERRKLEIEERQSTLDHEANEKLEELGLLPIPGVTRGAS